MLGVNIFLQYLPDSKKTTVVIYSNTHGIFCIVWYMVYLKLLTHIDLYCMGEFVGKKTCPYISYGIGQEGSGHDHLKDFVVSNTYNIPHTIHVWYIYLHEWLIFMVFM